ncbi:MAG: glycosyltransferase family 2 protein [Planctomycetota bacterium]
MTSPTSLTPERPRITLIVPTLNQGDYLEQTLCSVLDQGYDNLELIVIDGGSEDDTLDLIRAYEDQIAFWTSTWDRGPADAINQALRRATGQIVGVLGGDDLLLPYTLDRVAAEMTSEYANDDAPNWIVGGVQRIGDLDQQLGDITPQAPDCPFDFLTHAQGLLPGAASFYRRELLGYHGGFDQRLTFAYHYELQARLLMADCKPTLVNTPLAAVREHAGSRHRRQVLHLGLEYIDAAESMADAMPGPKRFMLWKNCDERRRIYSLAQSEAAEGSHKARLWQQLLRRPWWLGSHSYRRALLTDQAEQITTPESADNSSTNPQRKAA